MEGRFYFFDIYNFLGIYLSIYFYFNQVGIKIQDNLNEKKPIQVGIIIRTKNEEKWIGKCLEEIFNQTYRNFEVIVVDSGSTDKTLDIISEFPVKLIKIRPEEFSYPYALNLGCKNSLAQKYFVFLSAHSIVISEKWLENGLKNFEDKKVLGIYGNVLALPDGTIWEKIIFNKLWQGRDKKIIRKAKMGVLGFTNAIIRRDLWEKRNINEEYGKGGEDGEWAGYWLKQGYEIIRDPRVAVYHSHGLGLVSLIKQWIYWKDTSTPGQYKQLKYRKNG